MDVIFHLAWEWIYDGPVLLGSILLLSDWLRLQGFPQDFPDIRNSLLDLLQERHSSLAQGSTPEGNLDWENGTDLGVLKLTEEELNDDGSVYYLRASFSLKAKVHLGTEYKLEITNSAGVKKVITIKT